MKGGACCDACDVPTREAIPRNERKLAAAGVMLDGREQQQATDSSHE